MNVFAALATPILSRPGDPMPQRLAVKAHKDKAPFGLTECEQKAFTAIIEAGSTKGAASLLGLSHKTIEAHTARARQRIGVATTMHAILEWDRAKRKEAK